MKVISRSIVIILFASFLLAGCGATNPSEEQIDITLTISQNNQQEVMSENSYQVEQGTVLLDVLEDHHEVDVTDEGFITAIDDRTQVENEKYWLYFVNGEMASQSVDEYKVKDNDDIVFDLQATE
ncbi:hypothetical protein J416_05138 [Gracilibacillus halophilus YIM-C55.5]|uniref:Transcobalamin-like C-terminal domain-containing protein n=1 Tax=Gracilibacillus halophilus YIM-C55.5 TaxID=1308866 RepID=N4WMG4_9BACI|nr:DUF4430 domain-containing protein [Gracilibacillus halophilus]ENH97372.1 hypothetical protein J416_05138 [Gracilibacillus halophilus YIM-C55.5]